jgi:diguanylate cyclase (GGDEF)-like protein/PAS domain S-box-containing protein
VAGLVGLLLENTKRTGGDERYRALVEHAADGIVLVDVATGALVEANPAFRKLVGVPPGDIEGFHLADFVGDPSDALERLDRLARGGDPLHCDTTLRFLGQRPAQVEIHAHLVTLGEKPLVSATIRDLGRRRRGERFDRDRAAVLELVAQNYPVEVVLTRIRALVETHCPGVSCIFEIDGTAATAGSLAVTIQGRSGETHGRIVGRSTGAVGDNALSVLTEAARLAGLAVDQSQLTNRLSHQAQHDVLTGLPNRRLFDDRMGQAIASARRRRTGLALFVIDLDRFKHVNDSFGHELGDLLLKEAASRISHAVRASDTVARMGGDEFMVILPDVSGGHAAARVAQKLLDALRAPFKIGGHELLVAGSVGIALYPQDGTDALTLQRHADLAMYGAKGSGGDCFQCFAQDMNQATNDRMVVEQQLRRVIENGELSLFYQTQVSMDGATEAVEAYVRWQHPQLGFVLPARFIPVAEECGLIVPIGTWVLREACRQFAAWTKMGVAPPKVSINISGVQFAQADFVQTVTDILKETGVEPDRIELELTETMLMRNFDASLQTLEALRRLGVSVAIDDFGTGFSSLSQLQKLPIDALKVDPSFVHDLERPDGTKAFVEAIMVLARSLHLRVVAEGVENEGQAAILRAIGCESAQGHLYSRAMMGTDILTRLRNSVPPPVRPDGAPVGGHSG